MLKSLKLEFLLFTYNILEELMNQFIVNDNTDCKQCFVFYALSSEQ